MPRRFERNYSRREERPCIYIYTEGEVTEPGYFRALKSDLRLSSVNIKVLGTGYNTKSLVDYVVAERERISINQEAGDEVWVVFDRDDFIDEFNNAINKAVAHEIRVAYSNECFELWYLLHFELYSSDTGRNEYFKKLSARLKTETEGRVSRYEKNRNDMYTILRVLQPVAIKNAKKLLASYETSKNYVKNCPSTTVHLLVERLNSLT